jgi:hypothetical protein
LPQKEQYSVFLLSVLADLVMPRGKPFWVVTGDPDHRIEWMTLTI